MDRNQINEVIAALNRKRVTQPCPRCSSSNFSVVGESEISVVQPPPPPQGLLGLMGSSLPTKTTMPVIIVTCDNCGYVSQHALAALDLFSPARHGLIGRGDS